MVENRVYAQKPPRLDQRSGTAAAHGLSRAVTIGLIFNMACYGPSPKICGRISHRLRILAPAVPSGPLPNWRHIEV